MAEEILAPTTFLEAVNRILASIGEQPVATLDGVGFSDVALAKDFLIDVSREVQSYGYNFNTDYDWSLAPTMDNEILIPANSLAVDPMDPVKDYVARSGKLYNREDRTFTFTEAVDVEIIWLLAFEDLPEQTRFYITMRAARKFQDKTVGATDLHGFDVGDEAQAKVNHERAAGESKDRSAFFNNPYAARLYYR